ncbi:MAG: PEP-CTERM sorting domain-containing protein [Tepidisphaeraceae bacterium]
MGPRKLATILLACSTLWAAKTRGATSASTQAVADAFLLAVDPAGNYGGGGGISVAGSGTTGGEQRSLIRFDASSLKTAFDVAYGVGGWAVTSAQLDLDATTNKGIAFNLNAVSGTINTRWMSNDAWTEGTGRPIVPTSDGVTWNDLSTLSSPSDESTGSAAFNASTLGLYSLPLTVGSGFLNDLKTGALVTLQVLPGDGSVSGVFHSSNFASGHPTLVVATSASVVPEPTTLLLMPLAVLVLKRARHTA